LPQIRYHELLHDRKGQLAADLDHPYRLIFRPFDQPPPVDENGRLIWDKIQSITILAIEDYHD